MICLKKLFKYFSLCKRIFFSYRIFHSNFKHTTCHTKYYLLRLDQKLILLSNFETSIYIYIYTCIMYYESKFNGTHSKCCINHDLRLMSNLIFVSRCSGLACMNLFTFSTSLSPHPVFLKMEIWKAYPNFHPTLYITWRLEFEL
jgi:hypothetical protein